MQWRHGSDRDKIPHEQHSGAGPAATPAYTGGGEPAAVNAASLPLRVPAANALSSANLLSRAVPSPGRL